MVPLNPMVRFLARGAVLFTSDNEVRKWKALYVNLAAGVADVGSAVDPLADRGDPHHAIILPLPQYRRYGAADPGMITG